jgi:glycosyltransferase involved in cell wall biosynthesis
MWKIGRINACGKKYAPLKWELKTNVGNNRLYYIHSGVGGYVHKKKHVEFAPNTLYYIPYTAEERNAGKTSWSFRKLLKYAGEGFLSFTTFPLRIATYLGTLTSFAAVVYFLVVVIQKLTGHIDISGYATIVALILLMGGIQLIILGIIGEYLARTYIESKKRPIFIEKQYITYDEENS